MTNQYGPKTKVADDLHAMKYRGAGEDFRESQNRIAFALKDSDSHYHALREIFLNQRFMPAGRIQSAMGAIRQTTAYNCFVSGTIEDAYVEGQGSIMGRAHQAAATMRMGGGIGYDFSTLRPRGFRVAKIDSQSSGPVSFMPIFDAVCQATSSYGHRRGAQMAVFRVDHPDIEEFIAAKQNDTMLKGFNVSVGITDAFMEAAISETNNAFDLMWDGKPYRTIDAKALMEKIMRSTWDWAEPGVLFLDTINNSNNLWYCEKIAASNPCGEQPLPPFGACLLGSFNLTKYLVLNAGDWKFNWNQLRADIPHVVRGMDNVVDRSIYPLSEQRAEAISKRRMGLGVAGLANALEAILGGPSYGSEHFVSLERNILRVVRDECYRASVELAKEKGAFPHFDPSRYVTGKFIEKLPVDIRKDIFEYGIRNSHLTSIAPTGTISMTADNISSGIEPVFAYKIARTINTPDGQQFIEVDDYGAGALEVQGKLSADVTAAEHVAVLLAAQEFVDSAVSKTCNVSPNMPWADFKQLYVDIWRGGGKGATTFNSGGKRFALLKAAVGIATVTPIVTKIDEEGTLSCEINSDGQRSCE